MGQPTTAEPNVARYLLRALRDEGVDHVFLVDPRGLRQLGDGR
jgi:hypothetical protein